jgi:hypothetical protein
MQKKKTSPVFWLALVAVAIAIFVLTSPQDAAKHSTAARVTPKKKAITSTFMPEDYSTKFEPVTVAPKNSFMPVVMKSISGSMAASAPNAIGTDLTGGEAGWAYTGTAEVNGHIQAVVENSGTGQGDFLSVGQNWKKAKVVSITDSALTLQGSSGNQVTIRMQEKLASSSIAAGGFAPVKVNSNLNGQIGGPVAIRPENTNQGATAANEGEGNAN